LAAATIRFESSVARARPRSEKATEEATVFEPSEFEAIEREEREARLRLDEARDRANMNEGIAPTEDQELLRRLEADWKRAVERLHRIRGHAED
jgi:hypothetical protein